MILDYEGNTEVISVQFCICCTDLLLLQNCGVLQLQYHRQIIKQCRHLGMLQHISILLTTVTAWSMMSLTCSAQDLAVPWCHRLTYPHTASSLRVC